MGRLITSRTAEINKHVTLYYANRTSDEPISTPYGERYVYNDVNEINLCLVPLTTKYEAEQYGVNLQGSFKASLTIEERKLFNEFTHIWLENYPENLDESEYIVANIPTTLNYGMLVIEKNIIGH